MIPVNEPLLSGNEEQYLSECIRSSWISSEGSFVSRLEEQVANKVDRQYGIAVCNGSAALELAVTMLELGPGDEVILPAFTIISCAAAILRSGAMPVVVDCEPDSWNMSVKKIEAAITEHTKAIMMVHIYGMPVDIDQIIKLAKQHRLYLIEDAAEVLGQTYKGKPCGSFGDISTFSFYPNKQVTTGEGGMVLTNDLRLMERGRSLMNLCFQNEKRFVHEELGWNFRMSNLQAAVGVAQMEKLDETIKRKREIGQRYNKLFESTKHIQLPMKENQFSENIYWIYGIVLSDDLRLDAEQVMKLLTKEGIGTRPFFWPMHKQPVFQKMGLFENNVHPVSEKLSSRGFYIPSGLAITEEQQQTVAKKLLSIIN